LVAVVAGGQRSNPTARGAPTKTEKERVRQCAEKRGRREQEKASAIAATFGGDVDAAGWSRGEETKSKSVAATAAATAAAVIGPSSEIEERMQRVIDRPPIDATFLRALPTRITGEITRDEWRAVATRVIDRPVRARYPDPHLTAFYQDPEGAPQHLYMQRIATTAATTAADDDDDDDDDYYRRARTLAASWTSRKRATAKPEPKSADINDVAQSVAVDDLPRELDDATLPAATDEWPRIRLVYVRESDQVLARLVTQMRLTFTDRDPDMLRLRYEAMAAVDVARPYTLDRYAAFFEHVVTHWVIAQLLSGQDPRADEPREFKAYIEVVFRRQRGLDEAVRALATQTVAQTREALTELLNVAAGFSDERAPSQLANDRHRHAVDHLRARKPEGPLDVFYLLRRDPVPASFGTTGFEHRLTEREHLLRTCVFITLLGVSLQRLRVLVAVHANALDPEFEHATKVPVVSRSGRGPTRYVAPPSLVPEYLTLQDAVRQTHPLEREETIEAALAVTLPTVPSPRSPTKSVVAKTASSPSADRRGSRRSPPPPPPLPNPVPSQLSPDTFASVHPASLTPSRSSPRRCR
jgi:hypothetical protein